MNFFIVHVNLGCCSNNSDGKMFVLAESEQMARGIVSGQTTYPITQIDAFNINNEVVYSSFKTDKPYRFKGMTDNWGYLPEKYVIEHNMDKTWSESWQRNHRNW